MISGKFRKLLLKNTLAYVLPTLMLLIVLVAIVLGFPVIEKTHNINMESTDRLSEELQTLYSGDKTNVIYEAKNLFYTGIDYKEDGERKGAYYYNIDEGGINFFLIKIKNAEQTIDSRTIKAQIVRNEVMKDYIISQLTDNSSVTPEMLEGYSDAYILSEIDYPYAYITLIYIVIFLPIIAGVLVVMYTVIIWVIPTLHPQTKQLEEYGPVINVINELDYELKEKLLFKHNNIYVTEEYLIVSYLTRTDVIKLDLVKYLSKNEIVLTKGIYKDISVFRLTFSNPEKLFYEVDFSDEELVDTVIEYILPGKSS